MNTIHVEWDEADLVRISDDGCEPKDESGWWLPRERAMELRDKLVAFFADREGCAAPSLSSALRAIVDVSMRMGDGTCKCSGAWTAVYGVAKQELRVLEEAADALRARGKEANGN